MSELTLQPPPQSAPGLIEVTPLAIRHVKELLAKQEDAGSLYLRIGVKGGGCSGFSYVLQFDKDVDEKFDRFFEFDGVKVVVDRKSLLFLAGTTLDYTGELLSGGFEFKNPNARKSCGCGTSFQA
jgi:iron-sulfur cluster assembly protein